MTVAPSFKNIEPIDGELRTRISTAVESLSQEMFETIRELVRIPSVCGNERAMSERMQELYHSEGLAVETQKPEIISLRGHPGFGRYPNVISRAHQCRGPLEGIGGGGAPLFFNGHVDVVEPGDTSKWTHNPWGGDIEGDWMYGPRRWRYESRSGCQSLCIEGIASSRAGAGRRFDVPSGDR